MGNGNSRDRRAAQEATPPAKSKKITNEPPGSGGSGSISNYPMGKKGKSKHNSPYMG